MLYEYGKNRRNILVRFYFLKALDIAIKSNFQKQKFIKKNKCDHDEGFSAGCQKVIGFASTTLHDWIKKSKTKANRDSLVLVFPRFTLVTCN